jgi:hypothetical protein
LDVSSVDVQASSLASVTAEVVALFEQLFADIERIRQAVLDAFTDGRPAAADVAASVEPDARALLDKGLVLGAGFVAGRDALSDQSLYLAWWQGDAQQLLGGSDAPGSGDPFDYTRREWFQVPERTGNRHVTGPYVDYVCTDEYVVTSTAPVVIGDGMVGVVGADTLVETLEKVLLSTLRSAGATLVNEHGRTVASADHRIAAGALVDLARCRERMPCGDLPLSVVVAP